MRSLGRNSFVNCETYEMTRQRPSCPRSTIPKGLHQSAQGCEERATLDQAHKLLPNPNWVASMSRPEVPQPLQGCEPSGRTPRVARSSQPWAKSYNPVGIVRLIAFVTIATLFCLVALAETSVRPHAYVEPIALGEARWTSGFWADRFELCRMQMIPSMERLMSGTNYTHFLRNFEIAAGLAEGRYRGAPFNDGDFYKWMEAACATLAVEKNPE